MRGISGHGAGLADEDALAGGKTISFDDDGRVEVAESLFELGGGGANCVFGRGNLVALHELLGEGLAGFEAGGGLSGSEDAETAGLESVNDAEGERQLGSHDGEGGLFGFDEANGVVDALDIDGDAAGDLGDAAVAWRADDFRDSFAALDRPGELHVRGPLIQGSKLSFFAIPPTGHGRQWGRGKSNALRHRACRERWHFACGGLRLRRRTRVVPVCNASMVLMVETRIKQHQEQVAERERREAQSYAFRRNQAIGLVILAAGVCPWWLFHTNPKWILPPGWWRW